MSKATKRRYQNLILLLLLVSAASSAHAEGLAILDLRFDGMAPATIDPVRLRVQTTLAGLGYRVLDETKTKALLRDVPPGCSVGPCLARVGRTLQVERVLVGTVFSLGSSYELTITMLETGSGTVLAQVTRRCDVCNFREVETAAAHASEALHRRAQAALAHRSKLMISSVPSGAEVSVDGLPQGRTPTRGVYLPGRHHLEATAQGLPPLQRTVELRPGEIRSLVLNLTEPYEAAPTAPAKPKSRYPGWVKWTALSGGLTLLGSGVVLCAVDNRPMEAEPEHRLSTRSAGITLVGTGAVAVVAAAVLWYFEKR